MQNLIAHASNGGEGRALARVKAPVRLLNSDFMPTDLQHWQKHHSDVELTIMPGVGHFLMLENPGEFNRLLENILRDLR